MSKAVFLVSLDFESYWGWRDVLTPDHFRARVDNIRPVVLRLLDLFDTYAIHATWATVGLLFFHNRDELLAGLPRVKPDYELKHLSPYHDIAQIGNDELEDPFHYAPSLISQILATPYQEIGTHTFSHYYCLEKGQSAESFRSDLNAAVAVARRWGVELRSIVFPRNQVNPSYLETCAALGIRSYRGTPSHWIYSAHSRSSESQARRGARLLDAYFNLSGHNVFPLPEPENSLINLPASQFLRPYWPTLRALEPLRYRRIRRSLDFAAKHKRIYHLWFHPEDFALNVNRNLTFLEKVLRHVAALRRDGLIESRNMHELAVTNVSPPPCRTSLALSR